MTKLGTPQRYWPHTRMGRLTRSTTLMMASQFNQYLMYLLMVIPPLLSIITWLQLPFLQLQEIPTPTTILTTIHTLLFNSWTLPKVLPLPPLMEKEMWFKLLCRPHQIHPTQPLHTIQEIKLKMLPTHPHWSPQLIIAHWPSLMQITINLTWLPHRL